MRRRVCAVVPLGLGLAVSAAAKGGNLAVEAPLEAGGASFVPALPDALSIPVLAPLPAPAFSLALTAIPMPLMPILTAPAVSKRTLDLPGFRRIESSPQALLGYRRTAAAALRRIRAGKRRKHNPRPLRQAIAAWLGSAGVVYDGLGEESGRLAVRPLESGSELNGLAARARAAYETALVYDAGQAFARYAKGTKAVFQRGDRHAARAIILPPPATPFGGIAIAHELRHAWFARRRDGGDISPFHGGLEAKAAALTAGRFYERFFSFEELSTHAFDLELLIRFMRSPILSYEAFLIGGALENALDTFSQLLEASEIQLEAMTSSFGPVVAPPPARTWLGVDWRRVGRRLRQAPGNLATAFFPKAFRVVDLPSATLTLPIPWRGLGRPDQPLRRAAWAKARALSPFIRAAQGIVLQLREEAARRYPNANRLHELSQGLIAAERTAEETYQTLVAQAAGTFWR